MNNTLLLYFVEFKILNLIIGMPNKFISVY